MLSADMQQGIDFLYSQFIDELNASKIVRYSETAKKRNLHFALRLTFSSFWGLYADYGFL
jgi:hypothetical protein